MVIAEVATRQHGVVSRRQLLAAGIGRGAIDHRVKCGRLHPIRRGVYLLGAPTPSRRALQMSAVLACGPGAVLSHRSAAELWVLLPGRGADVSSVTVPGREPGSKPHIRIHRVNGLEPDDVRRVEGIPVTAPARTMLDLAAHVYGRELEQALAEALRRRLVTREQLSTMLRRHHRRSGTRRLRAVLEPERGPAFTRSAAEERLLRLVRRAELPAPDLNVKLGDSEVDFAWRDERLVVEVDGFSFHGDRRAFERDRQRDAALAAAGWLVMRVTWRQLRARPEAVLARLAAALARRR